MLGGGLLGMAIQEILHGQLVAQHAKTRNNALALRRDVGMVAERFPRKNVGYMQLDHRRVHRSDGIGQGQGGVRISPRVEDNTVETKTNLVNFINQGPFVIRLEVVQVYILVLAL